MDSFHKDNLIANTTKPKDFSENYSLNYPRNESIDSSRNNPENVAHKDPINTQGNSEFVSASQEQLDNNSLYDRYGNTETNVLGNPLPNASKMNLLCYWVYRIVSWNN